MGRAPVLMVQGTASSAGKSTIVTGLCRLYARRGLRVAPFKAQNMSNNAAVCPRGGEIGRAQYTQAEAAGVQPSVDMNPILLKPQADGCQVVVRGTVQGVANAADYFDGRLVDLWPVIAESLDGLREQYDLVIAEGAGSPAEINLRARDLANMRVALYAQANVLLVADIDRGGAFASLLGTLQWLAPEERALVRGFILNRFRGDPSLLAPGPALLEEKTGIPLLGVVPFVENLGLPEEDAVNLPMYRPCTPLVDIALVRLPHIANFDEFGSLGREPGVQVRYVSNPHELRAPDLVILPGTKATLPDLEWLHESGLGERICWLAEQSTTPVLGICGGYQMLGRVVCDPEHVESQRTSVVGLGLLPVSTSLTAEKQVFHTRGRVSGLSPEGIWGELAEASVVGYEIHVGRTESAGSEPFLLLEHGPDGAVGNRGNVAGTYVHGLLDNCQLRQALIGALAAARGFVWQSADAHTADPYDRLADVLELNLRLAQD